MTMNLKLIAVFAGVLLVAACGGGGGVGGANAVAGIESLGNAFVAMFNALANGQPVDAQTVNIAVNATADPFNP